MVWWEAQSIPSSADPASALRASLDRIQSVIDELPPELRWRGGLSRPTNSTHGHDAQIANLFITSLHLKSNLLQKFAPREISAAQHQNIVDDMLEVLYNLPNAVLDSNGAGFVPKIRDIGAVYIETNADTPIFRARQDRIERMLRKLEDIDAWGGLNDVESPNSAKR